MTTYILGDIHSAYDNCLSILRKSYIIDENMRWRKGLKDTLIQVGDVIDRGDDSVNSFFFLRDLQNQAKKEGGRVIRLLGNHELSYIGGTRISERPEGYALTSIIKEDVINGDILAAFLLDGWVVVHAGVTEKIFSGDDVAGFVDEVNIKLKKAVMDDDFSDDIFLVGRSRGGSDEPGIFWADYYIDLLSDESGLIKQIVGHSPAFGGKTEIELSSKGKIYNVDVGICKMYGSNKGLLIYYEGIFTPLLF